MLLIAAALGLLAVADRSGWLLYAGGDLLQYDGRAFAVSRVIDGQTLEIDCPDGDQPVTRVRLFGIAPTPSRPRRGRAETPSLGAEAQVRLNALLAGRKVQLQLEPARTRDVKGRLMAFVRLPGEPTVNETLLAEGLARPDPTWPHTWEGRYAMLADQAQLDHGREPGG